MMIFQIPDMHCGHCAGRIAKAVKELDGQARVTIDMVRRRVVVASFAATLEELREVIADAGYTPRPMV